MFLFLNQNICCGPSLELSWQDGSNEGSQYMFFMENYKKLSLIIPINSSVEHYVQFFDGCLDYFVNPY